MLLYCLHYIVMEVFVFIDSVEHKSVFAFEVSNQMSSGATLEF